MPSHTTFPRSRWIIVAWFAILETSRFRPDGAVEPSVRVTHRNESMSSRWQHEQSLVTITPRDMAWDYWSDMQNHADMEGVAIELDGPFCTGTTGRTIGSNYTQEWELSEVLPRKRIVVTGKDGDMSLSFAWEFHDEGSGTRMTQRIFARGPQGVMQQWESVFLQMKDAVPKNMQRLADRLNELSR